MPFVIDVSAAMPWVMPAEDHPDASAALERATTDQVHAPALWWFELRNALVVGERRGRVTSDMTHVFLGRLARMDMVIDRSADEVVVLDLARAHRLTVYDAACLGLALRGKSALATLDSALAKAARRAGVALVEAPA